MVEQDPVLQSLWFSLPFNYPLYLEPHSLSSEPSFVIQENIMTLADKNFNFGAFKDIIANKDLVVGDAVKVGGGYRDTEKRFDKELCLQLFIFVPPSEMIYVAQNFIIT